MTGTTDKTAGEGITVRTGATLPRSVATERQEGMARALGAEPRQDAAVSIAGGQHDAGRRGDPIPGYRHPGLESKPRCVLVTALGPSKQALLELQTNHQPPTFGVDQVWGINAGVNWLSSRVSFDALFVLDYLAGEAAKFPRYGQALKQWANHHEALAFHDPHDVAAYEPRRIITTVAGGEWDEIAIEYPLQTVWRRAYQHSPCLPYLVNSIPMVLLYAWAIGVEELHLWGADYNHPQLGTFREPERANCEYWVGWCRAAGMRVIVPECTTLLGTADLMQAWRVYGYPPGADRHPRLDASMSRILMPGEEG